MQILNESKCFIFLTAKQALFWQQTTVWSAGDRVRRTGNWCVVHSLFLVIPMFRSILPFCFCLFIRVGLKKRCMVRHLQLRRQLEQTSVVVAQLAQSTNLLFGSRYLRVHLF